MFYWCPQVRCRKVPASVSAAPSMPHMDLSSGPHLGASSAVANTPQSCRKSPDHYDIEALCKRTRFCSYLSVSAARDLLPASTACGCSMAWLAAVHPARSSCCSGSLLVSKLLSVDLLPLSEGAPGVAVSCLVSTGPLLERQQILLGQR